MFRRLAPSVFVISSCVAASLAGGVQPASEPISEPLVDIRIAGLHEVTPHEKDRALHAAMQQVMARLSDLRAEMDLEPEQSDAIALAWSVLSGGLTLRVESMDEGPRGAIVSRPGAEDTAAVFRRLRALLDMSGMEVEEEAGNALIVQSPAGPVRLTMDQLSVAMRVGEIGQVPTDIEPGDLPQGVDAIASGRIDLGGIMEIVGPQIEEAMQDMPEGVFGVWMSPEAPVMHFAVGLSDGRAHSVQRIVDAEEALASSGIRPGVVFQSADFSRVPSDAVRLYAQPLDTEVYLAILDAAGAQAGEDPLAELNRLLNIDIREDLLAHLGSKVMIYQAESTGGGGLMSTVGLIELDDAEAFAASHERVVESINREGVDRARGYIRVREWTIGGADGVTAYTLATPGLPIPVEISWAIADGLLVKALSRHGLEAAVERVRAGRGNGGSILDNPAFSRAVMERLPRGGAATVSFVDAPRLARKGYGLTTAAMAMIANGIRSPDSPDRVDGPLMPAFGPFVAGIEPSATIGWWDGDDFRSHTVMDGSFVVGMATTLGSLADVQALAIPMIGAGVMLPAIGKARATAQQLKSSVQVRTVVQGMNVYAVDNNDRVPESIEAMLERGMFSPEILLSPYGPAPDRGPSIAAMVGQEKTFTVNSTEIFAIDRAMMFQGLGVTNVAFADEHVELLTYDQLERYLEMPVNRGAREALGIIEY